MIPRQAITKPDQTRTVGALTRPGLITRLQSPPHSPPSPITPRVRPLGVDDAIFAQNFHHIRAAMLCSSSPTASA
jgi:hypothetical protein